MEDDGNEPMDASGIVVLAGSDENTAPMRALLQSVAAVKASRPSELDHESTDPKTLSELLSHANQQGGLVAVESVREGSSTTITDCGRSRIRDESTQIAHSGVGYG